ncbi:Dynamitin-domain-containing protein [Mucidula mucida]|nr:Dynamitin-domain-containing protein [Mucidula mucida]
MSATKYANLPDIDTAPDVYETDDVEPVPTVDDPASRKMETGTEELDVSGLMSPDKAGERFRKAEQRRERLRTTYESEDAPPVRLEVRLKALQAELSALETAVADADPTEDKDMDTGELLRGLVDVRSRLIALRKGRGRLVGAVLAERGPLETETPKESATPTGSGSLVGLDERVGELEKLVGSSTTALDEQSPLPPPLVPLITRLNSQVTLLTQPRHIDSISRRLKLLLSDLDRSSHAKKGEPNHQQLLPLINRLAGAVPQIPHILTRLKTLAALHAAAGNFQETLHGLEEEQKRVREALTELEGAVSKVETSLDENRAVVKTNVEGLETRMDALFRRLEST